MTIDAFQLLVDAITCGDSSAVRELVSSHPDVLSATDSHGWSALHYAASKGDCNIAKIIIDSSSDIDIKDNCGATPLHYAVSERNDVTKLLIAAGANVNSVDNQGRTPLQWAVIEADDRPKIIPMLIEAGVDPGMRDSNKCTANTPYETYRDSELWKIVEKALDDLLDNSDITLCTTQDYVVGYLVKLISDHYSASSGNGR
ncbi:MAG: ankyrin repeat domain-containing protein [Armatimonadota bacterium]